MDRFQSRRARGKRTRTGILRGRSAVAISGGTVDSAVRSSGGDIVNTTFACWILQAFRPHPRAKQRNRPIISTLQGHPERSLLVRYAVRSGRPRQLPRHGDHPARADGSMKSPTTNPSHPPEPLLARRRGPQAPLSAPTASACARRRQGAPRTLHYGLLSDDAESRRAPVLPSSPGINRSPSSSPGSKPPASADPSTARHGVATGLLLFAARTSRRMASRTSSIA